MKLYFVTINAFKSREVPRYLEGSGCDVQIVNREIQEILNLDLEIIVRDKVLKAYKCTGLPCVVEHGGILVDALQGLPGGLSKVVWDTVNGQICSFLKPSDSRRATARSVIGYCDGRQIHTFTGDTEGTLADAPRGDYNFQWDPVFIPTGSKKTYAEMGFPEKLPHSQAAKAWKKFLDHVKNCTKKAT